MLCRDKEDPFVCTFKHLFLFLLDIKKRLCISRCFVYCTSKINGTRVCLFIYMVVYINDRSI